MLCLIWIMESAWRTEAPEIRSTMVPITSVPFTTRSSALAVLSAASVPPATFSVVCAASRAIIPEASLVFAAR